jgi:Prokaryotic N-terminal methylation motif
MKIHSGHKLDRSSVKSGNQAAFTLVEVLIASTIFLMVVGAVVTTNIFGVRMMQITQPKLSASAAVRQTVNLLVADITSAKIVRIGSGDLYSFVRVADGVPKQGGAIQLYPSAATNVFIRYFWDASGKSLNRVTSGATNATVVANSIANSLVFSGEDAQGNILTNNQNNMVIGVTLQYARLEGAYTEVGSPNSYMPISPSNYYKSYQTKTLIVHRSN